MVKQLFISYLLWHIVTIALAVQADNVTMVYVLGFDNQIVENAYVQLHGFGEKPKSFLTDSAGLVLIPSLPMGTYTLMISKIGYKTLEQRIAINVKNQEFSLVLETDTTTLAEVTINSQTEKRARELHGIRATIADAVPFYQRAVPLTEVLNQTAGIRVRQPGGLGAPPEVSINGFQGRAVRYFKDDIPLDYLGQGYSIASIPVNSIDRVEVYKGVLPNQLGADALGGGVNIVSRELFNRHTAISYEYGSFNTHRATVNAHRQLSGHWFLSLDGFYNHSDNDYDADVMVIDPETRNPYPDRVRLFHNAYSSYYAEASAGLRNTSWTDLFKVSIARFQMQREIQHPALMTDPYGAIKAGQSSLVPSLRYKKTLAAGRLHFDQFIAYNNLKFNRTDTLRGQYDWYGNYTPAATANRIGESRQPSLANVDLRYLTARTHLNFKLNADHTIHLNYVYTHVNRKGQDPLGAVIETTGQDVLELPANYAKQVISLSLESDFLEKKLQHTLIFKHFWYKSSGIDAWAAGIIGEGSITRQTGNYWGIADALKFQVTSNSFVRASVEWANRLPEQDELFGNVQWIVPNFRLRPEKSLNANIGYNWSRQGRYHLEMNGFFRNTKDLILLIPIQAPYAQYNNQENVRGFGVELDGKYQFLTRFTATANATWQNLRLKDIEDVVNRWKNNARLRNTPYAFANVGLAAYVNHIFQKSDRLDFYGHYNYVREFYLETISKDSEPSSFLGLFGSASVNSLIIIPNQHSVNMGLTYTPVHARWSINLESRNLTDANLYDYYRVQRAGRSAHLKINYQI